MKQLQLVVRPPSRRVHCDLPQRLQAHVLDCQCVAEREPVACLRHVKTCYQAEVHCVPACCVCPCLPAGLVVILVHFPALIAKSLVPSLYPLRLALFDPLTQVSSSHVHSELS